MINVNKEFLGLKLKWYQSLYLQFIHIVWLVFSKKYRKLIKAYEIMIKDIREVKK